MSEAKKSREPRMPKLWEALITLLILIVVLSVGIVIFGASVHVPMFVGVCAAAIMAMYLGYKWEDIEKMIASCDVFQNFSALPYHRDGYPDIR